ncbi:MAG: methyltransferase family protein [Thermodesulfovibrionales bacterium]
MMNQARYVVAVLMVVGLSPLLLFWVMVHPFVGFWRRVGPLATYLATGAVIAGAMLLLASARQDLLARDFGTRYPLIALGIILLLASAALRVSLQRHMSTRTLMGLPELAPSRYAAELVTDGPYSRSRHPRYLQFLLALLGYALFSNYLASYAVFALWLVGIRFIAVIEEKELHDRFGDAYDEYCRRVPRFLPRLTRIRPLRR